MYKVGDEKYAKHKLLDSIVVLKNNKALYVTNILEGMVICGVTISGKVLKTNGCNVSLEIPKLGFLNKNGEALYISRLPRRQGWKQGINSDNCIMNSLEGDIKQSPLNKDLMYCIEENYPSLQEALLRKDKSVAVHRDWAITLKSKKIYYKWDLVGELTEDSFSMKEKYLYLTSRFLEDVYEKYKTDSRV